MSMKVYLSGKVVVIDQTAQPLLAIDRNLSVYRIENDSITIFNNQNGTISRTDTIANVQDFGGTPVGDLQDVVLYLRNIVIRGTSVSVPVSGGEVNTASNVGAGDGVFKQKVGDVLEFKSLIGGTGITLAPGTDDITINAIGAASEPNVVNVLVPGDLPSVLLANTAYVINGIITTSQPITSVGNNAMIIGRKGRDTDKIIFTAAGAFINVIDANFTLRNITLSATDPSSKILNGDNYSPGSFNEGRIKFISIFTCQFRNCYDVMTINGFDLVDINNTLFVYVQALNKGLEFHSTSKIEISSCELIRWFDETTIPAPSGYATAAMFCIIANGTQAGVGAVNINGSIFHPQQTQDGIKLDPASTTGFGTIASNTFINIGLTTGLVGNFDYDIQNSYIVQANQGLENGNAKGLLDLTGNIIELDNSSAAGPPYSVVVNDANFIGAAGPTNPITFPLSRRVITSVANGSFTYDSKINGNFAVSLNSTVGIQSNGTYAITIQFRQNGVNLPFIGKSTIRNSGGVFVGQPITLNLQGIATQGDVFDVLVSCDTADNVLLSELIVSGYQF
tara:strand:- start:1138 stop:2829 length:1692 start_codon:yes stop_codon:yes gene_type:complete